MKHANLLPRTKTISTKIMKSTPNFNLKENVIVPICTASCIAFISGYLSHMFLDTTSTPSRIYEKYSDSIVSIKSINVQSDPFSPRSLMESIDGTGSGFAFIDDKYIITNAHVIKDALIVRVNDHDAKVIGIDTRDDIALLEVENGAQPLEMCHSDDNDHVKIGDPVVAIGNPYEFNKTLTTGVVSGLTRTLENGDGKSPLINMIQTDTVINPGSSGSPLIDLKRECVIGVNTAILTPNGANSGLAFAVPIETANAIAHDMIDGHDKSKATLGVILLPDRYSDGLGIKGVIIADVIPDSIGDKIGLIGTSRDDSGKPVIGDIIVGLNGEKVERGSDLYKVLRSLSVGDTVELLIQGENDTVRPYIVTF